MFDRQLLAALGHQIRAGYEMQPTIDNHGTQIRVGHVGDRMIVTVVGTNEFVDWMRNFNAHMTGAKLSNNYLFKGRAHKGFYAAHSAAWYPLLARIANANTKNYKVIIQGHSQGAAVAQLYAARLAYLGYKIDGVCLWADPRVFDANAARAYNEKLADKTLHIMHAGDPVTLVPFALAGYRRTGGAVHYWLPDGTLIEKQPALNRLWYNSLSAWAKWRLSGRFDFASDDFHDWRRYIAHYI